MSTLEITDIQRGCTHDGPGLRTTVFLKGCPLHCHWCHNPETQKLHREIFYRTDKCMGCMHCAAICPAQAHKEVDGTHIFEPEKCTGCMRCTATDICPSGAIEATSKAMSVKEIMEQVCLDRAFYRRRGGLTVSGGEPTLQQEGLLNLLAAAKAENIHTCLETCGVFPQALVPQLLSCVDLFLYDIKDTDENRLKENTGASLSQILSNLKEIDRAGGTTVLRCILIPEINMTSAHIASVAELYHTLSNCLYVELLPYHPYGLSKTEQLGREGIRYTQPENDALVEFSKSFIERQVPVKLFGTLY